MQNFHILPEDKALRLISNIQSRPGIFLETTYFNKENHKSFLFFNPQKVLAYKPGQDVEKFFEEIEYCLSSGFWLAGYFTYEFGYVFEPMLLDLLKDRRLNFPLVWLGVFKEPLVIDHCEFHKGNNESLAGKAPFKLIGGHFNMDISEYRKAIKSIKNYLVRGHTYQVNFTLKYKSKFWGDLAEFYLHLRKKQPTSFTGFINDGERFILSFSPELFFKIKNTEIVTRPMKGTYRRGRNLEEDRIFEQFLRQDLKNRAENIMIVDLLRNDLGRVSCEGSVEVRSFFDVEQYPSLFQMTSTIKSKLKKSAGLKDIFRALFPSGSVTGAPKIRTMQIIERLEKEPRDVYTGSIGYISPNREACFNVAIRTLVVKRNRLEFGVGGGIVYDSSFDKEYQECLLKTNFLIETRPGFSLIETMLLSRGSFRYLGLHLKRLKGSCRYFQIPINIERLKAKLSCLSASSIKDKKYKIRVLVNKQGEFSISCSLLGDLNGPVPVKLSSAAVHSQDLFLYHKTTNRRFYDGQRRRARKQGFFEAIFTNEKGHLTEGCISNIFLLIEGALYTPPLSSGLLPGVLRQNLLLKGKAKEKILYVRDLLRAERVFVGNSVRGLIPANIVVEDFKNRDKISIHSVTRSASTLIRANMGVR